MPDRPTLPRRRAVGALCLCAGLLAPSAVLARPGLGASIGSRGARTYAAPPPTAAAPFGGAQIGRTVTPPQRVVAPPAPPRRPGVTRNQALAGGFAVGAIGVGLERLLSHSHGPTASMLTIGLEAGLLFVLVAFLLTRAIRGRRADPITITGRDRPGPPPSGRGRGPQPGPGTLSAADRSRFSTMLTEVQRAWTLADLSALGRLASPEMVAMFADQLRELARRGARNSTSGVELLAGDLAEAWREQGCDYATVALRYRMIDITTDATGRVLEGDASVKREVREFWTMRRPVGGAWMLSAIQQG